MKVETILRNKGGSVFTINETEPLSAAVAALNAHNVGALVVTGSDGALTGILSERDIVRRLGGAPSDLLNRPVSSAMTPNPFTCAPETDLEDVLQLMTEKRIRHLPVTENNALAGIISIGDVVKRKIEMAEEEAAALRQYIAS